MTSCKLVSTALIFSFSIYVGPDTGWTAPSESNLTSIATTDPDIRQKHLWLFNITDDPSETTDLSDSKPLVVKHMLRRLKHYYKTMVPPVYPNMDRNVNPALFGGVWIPWWDRTYNRFDTVWEPQVH